MDYTPETLREWDEKICKIAKEKFSLDWYDIEYELIDYYSMLGAMAFHGLPSHFNHWSFGKSFERSHHMYNLGMEGLPYELILNSNPSLAYLMRENDLYLQILIMAHCVGHSDFFKNNRTFRFTRPETIHGRCRAAKKRFQEYVENPNIGIEKVEEVIDACYAVQFQSPKPDQIRRTRQEIIDNYLATQKETAKKGVALDKNAFNIDKKVLEPDYDLLGFIAENGDMPEWKRDIIEVCRDEAQYFWPQMMTKVMNEGWACVTGDTLIDTPDGLITAKSLVENKSGVVFDGKQYQKLVDWHHNPSTERIKIKTNKGYVIHGSKNHKLWTGSGWKVLSELRIGDELPLARGNSTWSSEYQGATCHIGFKSSIDDICKSRGVSYGQVRRFIRGKKPRASSKKLESAARAIQENRNLHIRNSDIKSPAVICEKISNIVGMLIGDGGFYRYSNGRLRSGFTSGDDELKELFINQIYELFGVKPRTHLDGNRWRMSLGSDLVTQWFFENFGFETGNTAAIKKVPDVILKSPKSVVASFIKGLFDTDGCVDKSGNVIFVTTSPQLCTTVQEILLKFGIVSKLSHRPSNNPNHKDGYTLRISGIDAELFRKEIGFNLTRKSERLEAASKNKKWFIKKKDVLKVVDIQHDVGEVYDFTVENTHQYRASAFLNHNSHHHYHILHELDLPPEFHLPFIKSHNQVIRPHIGGINPYHLGFHMFKDIEKRYGREEALLAREVHNDSSFIRQYLTEELCGELNLFSYAKHGNGGTYIEEVSDKEGWKIVRDDLAKQVGGGGIPVIKVIDVKWDGTLMMEHEHDGRDLLNSETDKVISHIKTLWGKPVHLRARLGDDMHVFSR